MLTSLCHRRVFVFVTTFCLHLHLRLCLDHFLHRRQHLANLADPIFSELCQSIAATIGAQISAIRVKSFGYLGFILFGFQQTRPAPLRADPSRPEATRAGWPHRAGLSRLHYSWTTMLQGCFQVCYAPDSCDSRGVGTVRVKAKHLQSS